MEALAGIFRNYIGPNLVLTWDFIWTVVVWSMNNPIPGIFFGSILLYLVDKFVAWTPWRGDDGLWKILKDAFVEGMKRATAHKKVR